MKKGYLNDIEDELHSLGLVKIAQLLVDWMNIESSEGKERLMRGNVAPERKYSELL